MPKKKQKRDTLSAREIEREYGFAYQFFKSDKELWQLLQDAIKGNWAPQKFQAKLQDTKWFQKHSDVYRQNYALKYSDKGTYRERLGNYRSQIQNLAGQWGADLNRRELNRYAERAFMLGWSEAQILDHIAKEVRPGKGGRYGGQLATIQNQLMETAFNNGISLRRKQTQAWMQKIVRGDADVATFERYIRGLAANTYGAYAQEIRSGMNAIDIAAPYVQSMAQILELNPADVNMFDPTIRKALGHRNQKGEPTPLSVTDFEDTLRKDRRWKYTDQANEQMRGYGVALGKMFGVLS